MDDGETGVETHSPFAERYQLPELLARLAIDYDSEALERIERFVELLLRWNRIYNLTGARDERTVVRDHLIDCVAIIPVIEQRLSIGHDEAPGALPLLIDVGSGAGFPGLVIASLRPQWPIALVEPISKKVAFLTRSDRCLAPARSEDDRAPARSRCGAVARAGAGPRHFLALHLSRAGIAGPAGVAGHPACQIRLAAVCDERPA